MSVKDEQAISEGFDSTDEVVDQEDTQANVESEENETPTAQEDTSDTESEADESSEETEEDSDDETEDDSYDETADADETEEESDEGEQAEIARRAYQEREQKRKEREAQINQELQEYTQNIPEEDENGDPIPEIMREQMARSRQQEVELYKQKVDNNLGKLKNEYDKALNQLDVFKTDDPNIQAALGDFIDEFQAKHVKIDNYGNPVEVNGDMVAFLQNKAELIQRLTRAGAINEKKASAKTRSSVTPAPSQSQTKTEKKDPIMEGFDSYE